MNKNRSFKPAAFILMAAIMMATILDYVYYGFSGWPIAIIVGLPVLVWVIASADFKRSLVLLVVVIRLFWLPKIPWHDYKNFYIDCAQIKKGDSFQEVRELMSYYRLVIDATSGVELRADGLALLFHPSSNRSADWCEVYGSDLVTYVSVSPD